MEECKELVLLSDLGMKFPNINSKQRKRYAVYRCFCGEEFITQVYGVTSGNTKSCGCLYQGNTNSKTHGFGKHRLYDTWIGMLRRCTNVKSKAYPMYGGRGIKVCDRWLDIANFIEDMEKSYKDGLSLDRIDVNGKYEPDNCRWTTQNIQMQNTRDIKANNTSGFRGVTYNKENNKWRVYITVNGVRVNLGYHQTALEAGKVYERYVRLNNLEHNFTPALSEEEIYQIEKELICIS